MVTGTQLLSTIKSALKGATSPSPSQQSEHIDAIRHSMPHLLYLLSFPPPKASDRAQVQSKEVRLPDLGPIPLDDQNVQIAIKLSDDFHLNEIDSVRLLVSANQEWKLQGQTPLDILRFASGLWYTERRDLIDALYTLLWAVVINQRLDGDLPADIIKCVEDVVSSGLRQRLISLLKELNREDSAGLGGPNSERHIFDSRGAFVERRAVVCRERLVIGHCLVLSLLVVRASPKDVIDIFATLKDSLGDIGCSTDIVKNQIAYSLLFSLIISLISDALSASPDTVSILSQDASFARDFQETVMAIGNNQLIEGCMLCVRLAWAVHLMIIQAVSDATEMTTDGRNIVTCLESVLSGNVFQFLLNGVLRTPAYQNDDEDMIYVYNAYLHELMSSFLSHPLAIDKVKETKDYVLDGNMHSQQASEPAPQTFVSLLEFVSEIYGKEPELLSGNDVLWRFVKFAGEDHTNFQTLVAFLKMLSTVVSSEEGASKVYELLRGQTFRSISWSTFFDCLSSYEEKLKRSLQNAGPVLPEIQEGEALVAYLCVLRKVVENGNPIEIKTWFPDIEPLFKLLSYENVPPYLKGALRNSIATFIHVSPNLKDTIWALLEQYDLPVVGPQVGQLMGSQVYDMRFELNEVEARSERYPSTISFLNLSNSLIAEERDAIDRGHRFIGIFRFICDHVFVPFSQRAYADPSEKWQLGVACLRHFQMVLSMYDIKEEDIDLVASQSQLSTPQSTPPQMQLPAVQLLKDFMSGKSVCQTIMGIIVPGVHAIIADGTNHTYSLLLEEAALLCLDIVILVLEKDLSVSEFWRPLYQPFDVILSQDHNQIVALLKYVRYNFHPQIQLRSIKIMSILSSRMIGLVPLLLKSNVASLLVEDYASCLELRSEGCQLIENSSDDPGVLIMQLLINNISRPAPNITHLILSFDLDSPVERTVLQPNCNYSCLNVILEMLLKPDVNASPLHEFGFQLLYKLRSDRLTSGPTNVLLSAREYKQIAAKVPIDFYRLLPEIQDAVLTLCDPLEVARMRATDRHLRRALTDPKFIERYNGIDRKEVPYIFAHKTIEELPGFIRGLRFPEGITTNHTLPLDLVQDDDQLKLLCINGSYCVFIKTRKLFQNFVLVVVHLTTGMLNLIPCPSPPMRSLHLVDNRPNLMIFPYITESGRCHYVIIHVLIHAFKEPEVSLYDSYQGDWILLRAKAYNNQSHEYDQIRELQPDFRMIVADNIRFYHVELHETKPYYTAIPVNIVFPLHDTPSPDNFFEPLDWRDWDITRHFAAGDQLWAASVFTHHNHHHIYCLKSINLYKFSEESNTYKYWDSIPTNKLSPFDNMVVAGISVQATCSMVQVGFICTLGRGREAKVFAYDIDSGDWFILVDPPAFTGVVLSDPFLTSRLTL